MSWLGLLVLAIQTFGPFIVELLRKLILKSNRLDPVERIEAKNEIYNAIQSKDEAKTEEVLNHWHKRCEGVGCPSDLVGETL